MTVLSTLRKVYDWYRTIQDARDTIRELRASDDDDEPDADGEVA